MSEFVFREALLSDATGIENLSVGINEGFDVTNDSFPKWLLDDRWYPYVVEVESSQATNSRQVIGLTVLNVTDGGKSVILRNSRISEIYRGRGLYKQLINFALMSIKNLFPSVRSVMKGETAEKEITAGYLFLKDVSRVVISYKETATKALESSILAQSTFQEKILTLKDFEKLFNEGEVFKSFFANASFHIAGEMFDLNNKDNWQYLSKRSDLSYFYTKNSPKVDGVDEIGFSVLSGPYLTNDGDPCITLNFFGDDFQSLKYHLVNCMKIGFQRFKKNFLISMGIHSIENQESLAKVIKMELKDFEILLDVMYKVVVCDIQQHIDDVE